MYTVDAHLDLAYNAVHGRDVAAAAAQQISTDNDIPSVGLPDLVAGNVQLICATLFCEPASSPMPGAKSVYHNAEQARAQAQQQLRWYYKQVTDGVMRIITDPADIPADDAAAANLTNAIILMEGADAMRSPEDVPEWFDAGLRMVGLAWRRTRMAGGTGEPGPLTAEGKAIVEAFDANGIIHDASHLAEQSFWDLLDLSDGPICASHSNCRAIVPTDRQLSDEMILEIAKRDGVVGVVFYEKFLLPPELHKTRRANLTDVITHIKRICDLTGNTQHVGIGTDMDGGFGQLQIPEEIRTSADMPKVKEALVAAGFSTAEADGITGGNWARFFRRNLSKG